VNTPFFRATRGTNEKEIDQKKRELNIIYEKERTREGMHDICTDGCQATKVNSRVVREAEVTKGSTVKWVGRFCGGVNELCPGRIERYDVDDESKTFCYDDPLRSSAHLLQLLYRSDGYNAWEMSDIVKVQFLPKQNFLAYFFTSFNQANTEISAIKLFTIQHQIIENNRECNHDRRHCLDPRER
jgi:hypothetical protein